MNSLRALVFLLPALALADVGPRPAACVPPAGCTTCTRTIGGSDLPDGGDSQIACRASAADAGLTVSDCTDQSGTVTREYYCPPGTKVPRACGCSSTSALSGLAALSLLTLVRRRR